MFKSFNRSPLANSFKTFKRSQNSESRRENGNIGIMEVWKNGRKRKLPGNSFPTYPQYSIIPTFQYSIPRFASNLKPPTFSPLLYPVSVSPKFCHKWEETIVLFKLGLARQGSPGSKQRSGWTRDIGFKVELLADDNELADFHPPTTRSSASRWSNQSALVCG